MADVRDWSERRYEVFFSSTYEDLKGVRRSLMEETSKLGHLASGMEFFPRGSKDMELITERIRSADVFVILVGARYGSLVRGQKAHFIDLEYDVATRLNKPILVYLLNDEEYCSARGALPMGDAEREYDVQLNQFRERVKLFDDGSGRIVGKFSLIGDLNALLVDFDGDLSTVIRRLPTGGWVRGEAFDEIKSRASLERTNRFFVKFVTELNKFNVLSDRTEQVPALKASIAKYFLERYLGQMIERGIVKFFFESGSSIAYVSQEFLKLLHDERWLIEKSRALELHTNNILTYIDFTLTEPMQIDLFPYGPPEKKYGATFGPSYIVDEASTAPDTAVALTCRE